MLAGYSSLTEALQVIHGGDAYQLLGGIISLLLACYFAAIALLSWRRPVLEISGDRLSSRYPIPFSKTAEVELDNVTRVDVLWAARRGFRLRTREGRTILLPVFGLGKAKLRRAVADIERRRSN